MTYLDSHGNTLEDYPRPSVAVDTAVLTITDGRLAVLLTLTDDADRGGAPEWRLPGTFVHAGETLRMAALRALQDKAGVRGLDPQQLRVFDDPDRDDRGWVLSVAHYDVVRADRVPLTDRTRLVHVGEVPRMKYDHAAIVAAAVVALRQEYRAHPDPHLLLGTGAFTLRDLRLLHETVTGDCYNPDTFRRGMLPQLRATGELRRGARGKPAELYVRG